MVNYCKCGCGTEIADDKTWVIGHNNKGDNKPFFGKKHTNGTKEKMRESHLGKTMSDESNEKNRQAHLGEKNSVFGKKQSDEHKDKIRQSELKQYAEMDDPGEQICMHHYIYDFNDLDKYRIPVTRREHMIIHHNLRKAGLEVPCINIMKED